MKIEIKENCGYSGLVTGASENLKHKIGMTVGLGGLAIEKYQFTDDDVTHQIIAKKGDSWLEITPSPIDYTLLTGKLIKALEDADHIPTESSQDEASE